MGCSRWRRGRPRFDDRGPRIAMFAYQRRTGSPGDPHANAAAARQRRRRSEDEAGRLRLILRLPCWRPLLSSAALSSPAASTVPAAGQEGPDSPPELAGGSPELPAAPPVTGNRRKPAVPAASFAGGPKNPSCLGPPGAGDSTLSPASHPAWHRRAECRSRPLHPLARRPTSRCRQETQLTPPTSVNFTAARPEGDARPACRAQTAAFRRSLIQEGGHLARMQFVGQSLQRGKPARRAAAARSQPIAAEERGLVIAL